MRIPTWLNRYRNSLDQRYSGKSRFVQRGFPKKTKNQFKEDWRARKGFARDQAKGDCFCKCNITDARHGHRRWQRDLIQKGFVDARHWEILLAYHKNMFTSAWDCC